MGVASLVLGIFAFLSSVVGGSFSLGWIGSIFGLLAIIFGAIASKTPAGRGTGKAGLILGILSFVWGIVATVVCVVCIGTGAAVLGSIL